MSPQRAASSTDGAQRAVAIYLGLQAVLGISFWVALGASDDVHGWLELLPGRAAVTDTFVIADLLVVVGGSALGSWAVATGRRWAVAVVWFTAGGIVYPTLYLLRWFGEVGSGEVLLFGMLTVSTLTCFAAVVTYRRA
jgi:hypothetical protein